MAYPTATNNVVQEEQDLVGESSERMVVDPPPEARPNVHHGGRFGEAQSRDMEYVEALFRNVDEAIKSEYYPSQVPYTTLTLDEISEALAGIDQLQSTTTITTTARRPAKSTETCFSEVPPSSPSSSSSFEAPPAATLDLPLSSDMRGVHCEREAESSSSAAELLLLSRSEEKVLLGELERDARGMKSSLRSYLKCAGENISNCFSG